MVQISRSAFVFGDVEKLFTNRVYWSGVGTLHEFVRHFENVGERRPGDAHRLHGNLRPRRADEEGRGALEAGHGLHGRSRARGRAGR